jgi:uncharacterized protein YjgD (DUF1641 family)
MAEPILLKLPPHDPCELLFRRLENAPHEHAAALLSAYDILQELHDKGVLELVKGALGSGDKVLEIAVAAGNQPEVIHGIRNFVILTRLFGSLEPKLLEHLAQAVPTALVEAKTEQPLGIFRLMGKLLNRDTRRILTIATRVVESLGKDLGSHKAG